MVEFIVEFLIWTRGVMPGLIVALIAGATAAWFGVSNLVAGSVALAAFLATFIGANVWHLSRARARLIEKHPRADLYIFFAFLFTICAAVVVLAKLQ